MVVTSRLGKPHWEQGHIGVVKVGPTSTRVARLRLLVTKVLDK